MVSARANARGGVRLTGKPGCRWMAATWGRYFTISCVRLWQPGVHRDQGQRRDPGIRQDESQWVSGYGARRGGCREVARVVLLGADRPTGTSRVGKMKSFRGDGGVWVILQTVSGECSAVGLRALASRGFRYKGCDLFGLREHRHVTRGERKGSSHPCASRRSAHNRG